MQIPLHYTGRHPGVNSYCKINCNKSPPPPQNADLGCKGLQGRSSARHTRRTPRPFPTPAGIPAERCARCFRLRKPTGPEALSSDPDLIRYWVVMSVSSKFHGHHIKRFPVLLPEVFHQGAGGAPGKDKKRRNPIRMPSRSAFTCSRPVRRSP
jgi:hypothetical protein